MNPPTGAEYRSIPCLLPVSKEFATSSPLPTRVRAATL